MADLTPRTEDKLRRDLGLPPLLRERPADTEPPRLVLTDENYYAQDANLHYLSASQYKRWLECQARWYHESILCDWDTGPTDAMLAGSYFHVARLEPGKVDEFRENHPEMFSTRGESKGELKATFAIVDQMQAALDRQPLCMQYLVGEAEQIVTGKVGGVWWRSKLDVLPKDYPCFTDLKSTKSITETRWLPPDWLPFPVARNEGDWIYQSRVHFQMALYQAILEQCGYGHRTPCIVAVSKETPCNVELYRFEEQDRLDACLAQMAAHAPIMLEQRETGRGLRRCENCEYCRATKVVSAALEA